MTCTDEKASASKPDRIAYRIRHDVRYFYLPTYSPSRFFVEVGHTLLAEQFDMIQETNGENGLVIRSRSPVEVRNGFR